MFPYGKKMIAAIACALTFASFAPFQSAHAAGMSASDQAALAGYWSPVLYQDVGANPEADIPVPVNFDGDWSALNSWDNIGNYAKGSSLPLNPSVYWSLVETETHYYISYDFFYAAHDPKGSLGDHENDMEGIMLTIRKAGTEKEDGTTVTNPNGEIELVLMPRHAKLGMYAPASGASYEPGLDTVYYDDTFTVENHATGKHIPVYSAQNDEYYTESEGDFGHALKPYNGGGAKGDTGYVFQWGGAGSAAGNMNASDNWEAKLGDFDDSKRMNYQLIPLETSLWPLRNDFTLNLWSSYGTFLGDDGKDNAANTP